MATTTTPTYTVSLITHPDTKTNKKKHTHRNTTEKQERQQ